MTSQINPNNIDGNFPVAGVPNNTQGFRDNFTNTSTNFQYASDEITELQNKGVFKAALTGTTLDNNMNDGLIYAVKLGDISYTYTALTATSGTVTVDYAAAQFQQINPTGNISLAFTNWPISGTAGTVRVGINVTNIAYTVTIPAAVSQGLTHLQGCSPGTPGVSNTITFAQTGNYAFEFVTIDGGTTVWIFDNSRPTDYFESPVNIGATTVSTSTTTGALTVGGGVGIGGNLNVGGNLTTYTTTGNVSFKVLDSGLVEFKTPALIAANTAGALNIVGSSDGSYQPVYNTGSMVHVTGNDGVSARVTVDSFGTNVQSAFVQRLARGTPSAPTAVQANDIIARITGSGYGNTGYVLAAGNIGTLGIDFVALENYSSANAGSALKFYTSTIGSVTKTLSANVTANLTTFPSVVSVTGNVVSTGNIFSAGNGTIGYNAGSGGTVSQTGNKSTGVTLNKPSGEITMQGTLLAADTSVSFTLTNSTIGARDLLLLNIVGGVATPGTYNLDANCTSGSAVITVRNITAGSLSESIVLRYAVIRGSIT